jgi:sugar/nucleoside kinase (ribokinase family)
MTLSYRRAGGNSASLRDSGQPKLPTSQLDAKFLFLGNIDPELQRNVLDQVKAPKLVVCDTMNYWIQRKKDTLLELLRRVDILMVNDSEARELSGTGTSTAPGGGSWPTARSAS